jgi:hypothetical protein
LLNGLAPMRNMIDYVIVESNTPLISISENYLQS